MIVGGVVYTTPRRVRQAHKVLAIRRAVAYNRETMFDSFQEIIDLWPTRSGLAGVMGHPVNARQVQKWYERDFIPCDYWDRLIAVGRGRGLSYKMLSQLKAKRLAA